MGGLSKKAFQFDKKVRNEKLPALLVDGGNLLFKKDTINPSQREQVSITAHGIVKSYEAIGYQGVGVAAQDLALGLDFLKNIAAQSNFPWLSANLYNNSTSIPIFTPSTIIEVGEIKVGLIGLTGNTDILITESDDASVKSWQTVLPDIVADLSAKTDMLVLLSNLTTADNKEIAKLYDIHIILQSGMSILLQP